MTFTDQLIAGYLARVELAAAGLPPARREELLRDLREHIDISRAESGDDDSEVAVRTILDRLGDPETIVAAADTQPSIPRITMPTVAEKEPVKPAERSMPTWGWVTLAVVVATVVLFCGAFSLFFAQESTPAPVTPAEPAVSTIERRSPSSLRSPSP